MSQAGTLDTAGQFGIVVTLISYDAGAELFLQLQQANITITFQTENIAAIFAGIDEVS